MDGGIEGKETEGGQVEPGGYELVWVNPLLLVLVVFGVSCGAEEFADFDDGLGCLLFGGEYALVHVGEVTVFGKTAYLDYGKI